MGHIAIIAILTGADDMDSRIYGAIETYKSRSKDDPNAIQIEYYKVGGFTDPSFFVVPARQDAVDIC